VLVLSMLQCSCTAYMHWLVTNTFTVGTHSLVHMASMLTAVLACSSGPTRRQTAIGTLLLLFGAVWVSSIELK